MSDTDINERMSQMEQLFLLRRLNFNESLSYVEWRGLMDPIQCGMCVLFDEQERDSIHDKVCVYTRNGDEFIGDYALIAVPIGVLNKNVIEFIPDLPVRKQESIAEMALEIWIK